MELFIFIFFLSKFYRFFANRGSTDRLSVSIELFKDIFTSFHKLSNYSIDKMNSDLQS